MNVPAAARSMARPPFTDPVKLMKSKAPSPISVSVVAWSRKKFWKTSAGTPASAKARTIRSPTSSVCVACLITTALPAISAGATVLIAVRYGIVPRRDDEDDAVRLPLDTPLELLALLDHHWRQRLLGNPCHVAAALVDAAELAAIAHRTSHHVGEFDDDIVLHCH